MEYLESLLRAGRDFAPHGYCLLWRPELVWSHVIADTLIAIAYFSIPIALIVFVRRRRDIDFGWVFWLFAIFIVACGLTHVMAIWTLWNADYALEALVKIVTAIASVGTAILLWPLLPKLLAIPSPAQLREQNANLETTLERLRHEMAERRRAEEALRQAQKMEAVGQLTGGIAHDFNNLLQTVTGSLQLIARNPQSERVGRWAELGQQAAERGARLTAQLLAFSRTQKLELKPTRIAPMLLGMRELLESAVGGTIRVDLDMADAAAVAVLGDATQLELAVMNLVINARDAMPGGGSVHVRAAPVDLAGDPELPDGPYLCLSVGDTGAGMSPDVAARAFDPFFTTKPVGEGTGLGLSMVYGVARQSGGRASIETAPGRGTVVSVLLPQVEDADAALFDPATGPASLAGLRILVVDDDPTVRFTTVSMLDELGATVLEADSGAGAIAMVEAEGPDIVLLDYLMPGMTGAAVAAELRRRGADVRIVFATGYADMAAIEDALDGEPWVLRKPFDLVALADALHRAGASRRHRLPVDKTGTLT